MKKISKKNKVSKIRFIFPLFIILGFILYLFTIPYIVQLRFPCLKFSPGASFQENKCQVVMALDTFITIALVGFAVVIFAQHVILNPRNLKHTLVLAVILSLMTIVAYHIYIPQAESQVKRAPIILEGILKE